MERTLLDSLSADDNQGQNNTSPSPQRVEIAIISIVSDLETIMEEDMTTATTRFPWKLVVPKKAQVPITSGPNQSDKMSTKSAGG